MEPPALTRCSQAAEVVGVAAECSCVPAAPPAPGAVAEMLELVGLAEVRPAVETAEQDLRGQRLLGPPQLPPRCPDTAGLPGTPALHRLHQQLQLLVLKLLEEGMRCRFEGSGAVLGAGCCTALPPQPPHQSSTARAEHGVVAGTTCRMGTGVTPMLGGCCSCGGPWWRPGASLVLAEQRSPSPPWPRQGCCAWVCRCLRLLVPTDTLGHSAAPMVMGDPEVRWDVTPKPTPSAGEPACAETARAGLCAPLPAAPTHPLAAPPPAWGWARGPWGRGGSHSRWAAELGTRSQGCAWDHALRVAGTVLPAVCRCQDFFLCRDALPSPGPPRLENSLIHPVPASPGAEPLLRPGQAAAGQAPDTWAPAGRNAQHHATAAGLAPRAAGHSQEPRQHCGPHRCMATGQGPAAGANLGTVDLWHAATGHHPGSPHPCLCPRKGCKD